jgi:hypothetical protein
MDLSFITPAHISAMVRSNFPSIHHNFLPSFRPSVLPSVRPSCRSFHHNSFSSFHRNCLSSFRPYIISRTSMHPPKGSVPIFCTWRPLLLYLWSLSCSCAQVTSFVTPYACHHHQYTLPPLNPPPAFLPPPPPPSRHDAIRHSSPCGRSRAVRDTRSAAQAFRHCRALRKFSLGDLLLYRYLSSHTRTLL